MLKADPGKFIKGYLVDINPFSRGLLRRILIDEHGGVFVDGWHYNLQSSYKVITFPNQIARWKPEEYYDEWWMKSWAVDAWSWIYGDPRRAKNPRFHACHVIRDRDTGHDVIFAS